MAELNFDVLHLIRGLLTNVSDVLSFSLTCSTLRPVAVERRLSMRVITIHSAKSIRDLHSFIFVDEKQRGQDIRAIAVPIYDESPKLKNASEELVDLLVAVFKSARRACTVSLYVPDQQSLFSHRRFLTAVSRMASIQELNLVAPLDSAGHLLFTGRSIPRTFRYSEIYAIDPVFPQPICMAPSLAATLEDIELPLRFVDRAALSDVSFPAARSLALTEVATVLPLDMLLAVFPNLDRAFVMNTKAALVHAHDRLATLRE